VGAGHGGGYALGKSGSNQAIDNHKIAASKFGTSRNGWLGSPGKQSHVQVIKSESPLDTALELFSTLSKGGAINKLPGNKGRVATFAPDTPGGKGSAFTLRIKSSKNDPVVDIKITGSNGMKYKIHFERKA
jgi:hypothetical protein